VNSESFPWIDLINVVYSVNNAHMLPAFPTLECVCQLPSFLPVTTKKGFVLVATVAGVVQRIWNPITKQVSKASCCPSYGETKLGYSHSLSRFKIYHIMVECF
jgi:hypothetical protein